MANMKHPNLPTDNDITDFISKVDEIDDVLKGLNSSDENNVHKYMSKADDIIKDAEEKKKEKEIKRIGDDDEDEDLPKTKTGFSKTSINKDAYKNDPDPDNNPVSAGPPLPDGPVDQRAFMAAMEADAKERAESRRKREKIANQFKDKGNAEFRQGNYAEALELYDKAMEQLKDSIAIYTNRAQTRIKLGMFTEALTDCHWALRLVPNCLKALVHQGHAHLGLKEFEKARDSYRQILDIDTKKEAMVKDYLATVDREEQATKDEEKALQSFEEGNESAKGIVNLLTRVARGDQLAIYYSGGFRAITCLLTDVESQTLFRTNGGLGLPQGHPMIHRCLAVPVAGSLSVADRDLLTAAMNMFTAACKDNETSQQQLVTTNEAFPRQILSLLDANFHGQGRLLKTACLNLMHDLSLTSAGRATIVSKFDLIHLISSLFLLMTKTSSYAETAAALLNNIALEKRLKSVVRDTVEEKILPAFESLLKSNKTSPPIISLASSTFTNLAADTNIRAKMADRASFWTVISDRMLSLTESKLCSTIESVLGLLVNVSTSLSSSKVVQDSNTIHESCYQIVTASNTQGDWTSSVAVSRSLVVLSNILSHFDKACDWMSQTDRILLLMGFVQKEDVNNQKAALKTLTVLTQNKDSVKDIVAENKGTSMLLKLLQKEESKREGGGDQTNQDNDEVILGNSILCLSHLATRCDVCSKLTKTNIIQRLLVIARDGRKAVLQSNAAILIGKLVKGDQRHLERLRELHGIEILHQCMKHVT